MSKICKILLSFVMIISLFGCSSVPKEELLDLTPEEIEYYKNSTKAWVYQWYINPESYRSAEDLEHTKDFYCDSVLVAKGIVHYLNANGETIKEIVKKVDYPISRVRLYQIIDDINDKCNLPYIAKFAAGDKSFNNVDLVITVDIAYWRQICEFCLLRPDRLEILDYTEDQWRYFYETVIGLSSIAQDVIDNSNSYSLESIWKDATEYENSILSN